MADGDIIHPTLKRRFQNVYGQICEGHWEPAQLGYKMLHPLKGQIKEYGNAPVVMGQKIVPILESAISAIENGERISFADLSNQIDVLGKNPDMNCQPRGRDLMQKAAKKLLVRIDHGEQLTDIEHALYKTYFHTIYVEDCESRIQNTSEHYKKASYAEVGELIHEIRPHVERGQDEFARQLVKYRNVGRLKRPQRLKEPPLTVDDSAW